MVVRAIICDFGGVLYQTPDRIRMRRWVKWLGLKNDAVISELINDPEDSPIGHAIMTGQVHENEVWEDAARRLWFGRWLYHYLLKIGFSPKRYNKELAVFLQNLRPRYKTGILTNAGDAARQTLVEAYHLDRLVDQVIISAEEGVAKPDEPIYHIALKRLGVRPAETIFIDDQQRNIATAQKVGITGVLFSETGKVIEQVNALL